MKTWIDYVLEENHYRVAVTNTKGERKMMDVTDTDRKSLISNLRGGGYKIHAIVLMKGHDPITTRLNKIKEMGYKSARIYDMMKKMYKDDDRIFDDEIDE